MPSGGDDTKLRKMPQPDSMKTILAFQYVFILG